SIVPRSEVGKWPGLSGFMVSSKDRIGWYARSAQLYYEVTFDGKATRFSGIASPGDRTSVHALALTDDNQVFVGASQLRKGSSFTGWIERAAPGFRLRLPLGQHWCFHLEQHLGQSFSGAMGTGSRSWAMIRKITRSSFSS